MANKSVEKWCHGGTAWRFEHSGRPQQLVDLALEGLRMAGAATRSYWLGRLERLDVTYVTHLMLRVPRLSGPTVSFSSELVRINRRRLLDAC